MRIVEHHEVCSHQIGRREILERYRTFATTVDVNQIEFDLLIVYEKTRNSLIRIPGDQNQTLRKLLL